MSRDIDKARVTTYDLTPEEREALATAAKADHLSVSQYVAAAVRKALKKRPKP